MKNGKLITIATLALASFGGLVVGGAACSTTTESTAGSAGSTTYGGSGNNTSVGGTAGTGGDNTNPAGGSGGAAAPGGSGGATGDVVEQYFSDPSAANCKTCLKDPNKMKGPVSANDMTECSTVVTACGMNAENCINTMKCIGDAETEATQAGQMIASLDCIAPGCITNNSKDGVQASDFLNCLAAKCGTECGATPTFSTSDSAACMNSGGAGASGANAGGSSGAGGQ